MPGDIGVGLQGPRRSKGRPTGSNEIEGYLGLQGTRRSPSKLQPPMWWNVFWVSKNQISLLKCLKILTFVTPPPYDQPDRIIFVCSRPPYTSMCDFDGGRIFQHQKRAVTLLSLSRSHWNQLWINIFMDAGETIQAITRPLFAFSCMSFFQWEENLQKNLTVFFFRR